MKIPARIGLILACAFGALAMCGFTRASEVTVVSRLGAHETTGREIRITYGSFENRLLARRVLNQAKAEAVRLGIAKLLVVQPVSSVPGRLAGSSLALAPSGETRSVPTGGDYVSGEFVAREVLVR